MESEFASWMDRFHKEHPGSAAPDLTDASLKLLQTMGIQHEANYLKLLKEAGNDVCEIVEGPTAGAATLEAMKQGRHIIYQGELKSGDFAGRADFLVKVPGASSLGDFHYEVWDTKLSRKPKPYFLIQLCCYAEMLEALQERIPPCVGIVLGDLTERRFRTTDYLYFYRQLKKTFLEAQSGFDHAARPVPNGMADHGRWTTDADQILEEIDHLSLVANIRKVQIRKLEKAQIESMKSLAFTQLAHIPHMEPSTFSTLKRQALLQVESTGSIKPKFEIIQPADIKSRRGLLLLSPASKNDVFFDMEGYPHVEGGLEYLFGVSFFQDGKLQFKDFWAHDREQEKSAFEDFVSWVYLRWQEDPSMHIYHYADYEVSALRRLMGRHGTKEKEVDELLRKEVFINLYTVLRQSMQVGTPSYSIKKIERLYREERATEVATAMDSVVFYQNWLESKDGDSAANSAILQKIRDYNKDDCDSTAQLADWLRQVQATHGIKWVPPILKDEDGPVSDARDQSAALARQILEKLPGDPSQSRIQRLLAHLLEFHWRESKPVFWAKYDRHEMTEDQLFDDPDCLGGLQRTAKAPQPEKLSIAYEYAFDSSQDTKLDEGSMCFFAHDLKMKAEIFKLDEDAGLTELKILPKQGVPPERLSLIPDEFIDPKKIASSIYRTVFTWHQTGKLPQAIGDFLDRRRPRLEGNQSGPIVRPSEVPLRSIIDAVKSLDNSTLCIQGPPGSGKTFTAANIIVDLLRDGKRIGVTSHSHKAITHLLKNVAETALRANVSFSGTKIQSNPKDFGLEGSGMSSTRSVKDIFKDGTLAFQLVGGTAWAFSDESTVGAFDFLFVDEAGQVSIANLLGMAPSTKNIVLMGDQMQLSQPTKGAHPEESGQSTLEYLLQDKQTIPTDFGVFLATTYRMHPEVCRFISNSVYEGRLQAEDHTSLREIIVPPTSQLKRAGIIYIPVEHEGNTQGSDEEVDVIVELIDELLKCKLKEQETERALTPGDILVMAPYNMQVRSLKNKLNRDYVGTVDKFQGQEAPVVITSMCASDGNESSRGLEFLFSKNRLNVAISRAKCLAIIVGSPRLARTVCTRVEQMELINLFCRIVEEGDKAYAP